MLYLETLDDVLVLTLCIIALPPLPGPGGVDAAPGPGGREAGDPGTVADDGGLHPRQAFLLSALLDLATICLFLLQLTEFLN